jgi:hypothetical protein
MAHFWDSVSHGRDASTLTQPTTVPTDQSARLEAV